MQKTQKNAKTQKNVNFRGKKAKNLEKNSRFFLENWKKNAKMQKKLKNAKNVKTQKNVNFIGEKI